MPYCRKCGRKVENWAKFCPNCGTAIDSVRSSIKQNTSKSKKKILIPIAICLLLFAMVGGGWYLWKNYNDYSLEGLSAVTYKYDFIYPFKDGLAIVRKDDKIGFIDKQGHEIVPCIYYCYSERTALEFHDGLVLLRNSDYHPVYIDKQGKEVISFDKKNIICDDFSEGLAVVSKNGKFGYIDTKGNEVIPYKYDGGNGFSEGLAAVVKDNKYGYIDRQGNVVIPITLDVFGEYYLEWDRPRDFHEGLAIVKKGEKYGYIDTKGHEIIQCKYDICDDFSEGFAVVCKDKKSGYINKLGKEIIPLKYSAAQPFSDGLALVMKEDKYSFIDTSGNVVFSPNYDGVESFNDGLALVYKGDYYGESCRMGYIDKSGNEVIPLIYERGETFSEGLAIVNKYGICGVIDKKGKSTFDCMTDETKMIITEKKRIEEEKRKKEEAERLEEERRRGVEKVVTLTYYEGEEYGETYCNSNYGAGYSGSKVTTKWIVIPNGKVWIYDHHTRNGNFSNVYLVYQSKEASGNVGSKSYDLIDGAIPVFRAGDKIFIGFHIFYGGPRTRTTNVYFTEKDEDLVY